MGGPAIPTFLESQQPGRGPISSMQRVSLDFLKSRLLSKSAHIMGSMRCSIMYWLPIFSGSRHMSLSCTRSGVTSSGKDHLSHFLATKSLSDIEESAARQGFLPSKAV